MALKWGIMAAMETQKLHLGSVASRSGDSVASSIADKEVVVKQVYKK